MNNGAETSSRFCSASTAWPQAASRSADAISRRRGPSTNDGSFAEDVLLEDKPSESTPAVLPVLLFVIEGDGGALREGSVEEEGMQRPFLARLRVHSTKFLSFHCITWQIVNIGR